MPGIAGIVKSGCPRSDLVAQVEHLEGALRLAPSWSAERWLEESVGVGMVEVARDDARAAVQLATDGSSTLVMEGELFGGPQQGEGQAERLLHGYLERGENYLAEIEGRFVAAIWSGDSGSLTLLTDKFGSKPLYYASFPGGLAFATQISGLTALPEVNEELNWDGLVQFFTFGHLWNDDTFFRQVTCLGPGMQLVYKAQTEQVATSQYWRPTATERSTKEDEHLQRISQALKRAVNEQTQPPPGVGVALSGGLDARTLLGLTDGEKVRPECICYGMAGSLDDRTSRRLAELAGCNYHGFRLDDQFLTEFQGHLERMIELTDGHYLSQCIVMPTLPEYPQLGVHVLLRGHVGELLHMHKAYNFSIDGQFNSVCNEDSLREWLWPRLQSHLTDGVDEPLLQGRTSREFQASGRRSLDAALQATTQWDAPLDRVSQLFLNQRTRRETAMSLSKFNSVVDVRLPYLDSRFISEVFAAPTHLRVGEKIQTYALRKYRPSFLAPPNTNTGAPVGAGSLRKAASYFQMKVLAKLGVRGYQPYERLGLWLRRELAPLVQTLLLDDRCLDRGLLHPDCVRNVVRRHLEGRRNHTFLLLAMMIVETSFRRSEAMRTAASAALLKSDSG